MQSYFEQLDNTHGRPCSQIMSYRTLSGTKRKHPYSPDARLLMISAINVFSVTISFSDSSVIHAFVLFLKGVIIDITSCSV